MASEDVTSAVPLVALEQGDILRDIPWGLIEAPLTICRPDKEQAPSGTATYAPVSAASKPFRRKASNKESVHAKAGLGLGMVAWHGCQIDKFAELGRGPERAFVAIAPVFSMSDRIPEPDREAVRRGNHRAYFPLPPFVVDGLAHSNHYVDVRYIWSVKQALVIDRVVARLASEQRLLFYDHIFTFFTRFKFSTDVRCPRCDSLVPTESLLVRAED